MGRPIITTDTAGCRETVVPNVNGYLVPVKSVKPLVKAMERMIETAPGVESMTVRLSHGRLDEDWSTPYYLFRRSVAILFAGWIYVVKKGVLE